MLSSGMEVGRYQIEGVLGQGGMGIVYEATQHELGRRVALKLLAAELSLDPTFRRRFEREGRMQAALDHAHVVPVYEVGELDGHGLFIAMRLVRGGTLKDLIRAGELDRQRLSRILEPLADALDTAHETGLVHRDVKPQNVLVGRRDHAYLADFGLTRATDETTAVTRSGQFFGTVHYVAPEQIRGAPPTPASDLYSFAALAYECLTGTVPFRRDNDMAVLYAHMSEPPPRPSRLLPGIAPEVDDVIAAGMAKSPADRPPSVLAFVHALEAALGPDAGGLRLGPPVPPVDLYADDEPTDTGTDPGFGPWGAPAEHGTGTSVVERHVHPRVEPAPTSADGSRFTTAGAAQGPTAGMAQAPTAGAAVAEPPRAASAEPAAGAGGGEASLRSRSGRTRRPAGVAAAVRVALATGLLSVVALVGLLAGRAGEPDKPSAAPAAPRVALAAGPIELRGPAGWRSGTAPVLPGLELRNGATLTGGGGVMTAGIAPAGDPSLLPTGLVRRVPGGAPRAVRIELGGVAAWRYRDLRVRDAAGPVTAMVVPTTAGVATITCSGSTAGRRSCESAAGSLSLDAKAERLGPSRAYAERLQAALGALRSRRTTGLDSWRGARTKQAEAGAAGRVAAAYRAAARTVGALSGTSLERGPQSVLRRNLAAAADAYGDLRSAARAGRRRAYERARRAAVAAERRAGGAVAQYRELGYRVR